MDAHALLTKQGWRGTGNSLHPTSNSIGLAKPLLVGRKNDKIGIGKKKHQTSDMWWMQAFDESLKSLDTTGQGTTVKSSVSSGGLNAVKRGAGKWVLANGGLYANFVRGTGLAGTLHHTPDKSKAIVNTEIVNLDVVKIKKKKGSRHISEDNSVIDGCANSNILKLKKSKKHGESKEERRARKAARRILRQQSSVPSATSDIEEKVDLEKLLNKEKKKRKSKKTDVGDDVSLSEKSNTVEKKSRKKIRLK